MWKTIGIVAMLLPVGMFAASGKSAAERSAKDEQHLAREIQEAVSKDHSLTPSGRKANVTVQNGVFTLSGVVHSEAERQAIQAKAESKVIQKTPDELVASSAVKIDNELSIAQ